MSVKHFPSAKISASTTHSVTTETTSGAPSASTADGALAVDITNDAFYFRSGSAWQQVAGSIITVADTAPSNPTNGEMWFESDTGNTLVYYTDTDSSQWVEIGHTPDSSHEFFISMDGGVPDSNYGGISTVDGGTV
jgi:hypothetical protein|tara:strand:- start:1031 stop:1438 length:408 start_codon:yes stop_codon:yes gene_type:complete